MVRANKGGRSNAHPRSNMPQCARTFQCCALGLTGTRAVKGTSDKTLGCSLPYLNCAQMGVFAMDSTGMRAVEDLSAQFLASR